MVGAPPHGALPAHSPSGAWPHFGGGFNPGGHHGPLPSGPHPVHSDHPPSAD
jgi:hypothetical protein